MREDALQRAIAAVYEAAADPLGWDEAGRALRELVDAQQLSLMLPEGSGGRYVPLMYFGPTNRAKAYAEYYGNLDPYRRGVEAAWPSLRGSGPPRAEIGDRMVPYRDALRTEFYADYLLPLGRRYLLAGMIGRTRPVPIGLHREAGAQPFGEREQRRLEQLLPHLERALDLRARLAKLHRPAGIGAAALEKLDLPVLVLDRDLAPAFVNVAAEEVLRAKRGMNLVRQAGPMAGLMLSLDRRDDDALLRRLVATTLAGGAGGFVRVRRDGTVPAVLMVSPLPPRLMDIGRHAASELVLVTVRDPLRRTGPSVDLLAAAFGLSRAEAEVAAALVGGRTAEAVARSRGVAAKTVQSQVRTLLSKSGAGNLREFERLAALLTGS